MTGARVSHECSLRVRWSEADPAGIVFYPRFFEWFDIATDALFAALGQPWPRLFPAYGLVGVPIVESGARFGSPVRYGDQVAIRSTVVEVREKTFRVEHEVSVDGRRCATGFEVRAWVPAPPTPGGRVSAGAIPEEIARLLREGK
ncbi:MAG: acyl-CoA thioesterase [Candidatus Rokubacteria bacterium]|nr:acyl-CoA thioesterase [Candidatus Rokubacteria bacterium]